MKALKYLLEQTAGDDDKAKLVLSSTWRVRPDFVQDIVDCLQRYGIQNMEEGFLDITDPNMHSERQWEIAKWLADRQQQQQKQNGNNNNKIVWLALDDENLLDGDANRKHRLLFEGHVVRTMSDIGLTMEDARKGVELWNQQLIGES